MLGLFLPDYWGRPTQTPLRPLLLERAMYAGALPLMLAAAALILRPTVERVAVALFGAFWLAVLFGVPPFTQIVTRLPLFSSGHNTRLIVLPLFAVALLAGWGLDELRAARRAPPARLGATLAVAAGLLVIPAAGAFVAGDIGIGALGDAARVAWLLADAPTTLANPDHEAVIRLSSILIWVSVAGAGVVLLALRVRGRLGVVLFSVLALLLVCADLFRAGMGYNPAIDRDRATVPATPAIDALRGQRARALREHRRDPAERDPDAVRALRGARVRPADHPPLRPALAPGGVTGVAERGGRPARHPARAARGDPARAPHAAPPRRHAHPARHHRPGRRPAVPGPPIRIRRSTRPASARSTRGPTRASTGSPARCRARGSCRRSGWSRTAMPRSPRSRGRTSTRAARRSPRTAWTASRTRPARPRAASAAGGARIVRYDDERVDVRAHTDRAGMLVLSDTWFPGWKAKVDGADAPVEQVDYVLRGVRLGPGEHTVSLRYEPASWTAGRIVSALALAGLVDRAPAEPPGQAAVRYGAGTGGFSRLISATA